MRQSLLTLLRAARWLVAAATALVLPVGAQSVLPIQDNSFLIEEAYNQESGVVQHVSTLSRMWNSKDFGYTFTQEWPGVRNPKHQFSYTVAETYSGAYAGTGMGFGDTVFNYRYQLMGSGAARVAFAPRISIMLPTGSVAHGRGVGGPGVQTNLPVSVVLRRRVVAHWNTGGTFVPHARMVDRSSAATAGYNIGGSVVFLAHQRVNVLMEATRNGYQSVVGPGRTEWARTTYLSPGIRWAHTFESGLQIVPGVGLPLGIGGSRGERGLFLYLSVEHPFRRQR
jgi:hypothetical protein